MDERRTEPCWPELGETGAGPKVEMEKCVSARSEGTCPLCAQELRGVAAGQFRHSLFCVFGRSWWLCEGIRT